MYHVYSFLTGNGELRSKNYTEHLGLTDNFNNINIGSQKKSINNTNTSEACNSASTGKTMVGWAEDVAATHRTPSRPVMPMSERQQIALLMQMSSPSPPGWLDIFFWHHLPFVLTIR